MKKLFEGKKINGEKVLGKTAVVIEIFAAALNVVSIATCIFNLKDLKSANVSKSKKTILSLVNLGLIGFFITTIKEQLDIIEETNEELDEMDYIEERK